VSHRAPASAPIVPPALLSLHPATGLAGNALPSSKGSRTWTCRYRPDRTRGWE